MSVASTVVSFNGGASGVLQITKKVGVIIGYFDMEASRCTDMGKISAVRYESTDKVKSRRKKLHAKRKG